MARLSSVEKWILLLVHLAGGELWYKTKLHKILFLLKDWLKAVDAEFRPYRYGPWSPDVEEAIRSLAERGLLVEEVKELEGAGLLHIYRLTDRGRAVAKAVEEELKKSKPRVVEVARKYAKLDLPELLDLFYTIYPEYTTALAEISPDVKEGAYVLR